MSVTIRQIFDPTAAERQRMIDVLVESFLTYTPYTDAWTSDRHVAETTYTAMLNFMVDTHDAWVAEVDGNIGCVALWVSPGRETFGMRDIGTVYRPILGTVPPKLAMHNVIKIFVPMMRNIEVQMPHAEKQWWYLYLLGTDPAMQGRGLGSKLLEHKAANAGGVPMCLSTQTERNVAFYGRHGFVTRVDEEYPILQGGVWRDRFMVCPADAQPKPEPGRAKIWDWLEVKLTPIMVRREVRAAHKQVARDAKRKGTASAAVKVAS